MTREFRPGRHSAESYAPEGLHIRADVAIIGAGAGGSAAAHALAAKGLTVAVLEEGRHWKPEEFTSDSAKALRNLYQGRGARSLRGNAVMPLPGGRGVGGSTLINSAICFRCPPQVLAHWRDELGCDTLEPARFDAYFDEIWLRLGVTVNPVSVQRNNNLIFRQGAEALGLDGAFLARSAPGCIGCGLCQYGCPSGGKMSADRSFLAAALATGRVGVYADCRMRSAATDGDQVTSVSGSVMEPNTLSPAQPVTVEADQFVICGGPIGSPLFLLANGLADNRHCGRHLVVHPTVGALAKFQQEIRPWSGVTQGYYVDRWAEGYLLQTYTVTPDQYYMVLQSDPGPETDRWMSQLAHMASAGVLVHDEDSEGRVQHTPAGPDLSYTLGDLDRQRLILGLREIAEVFFAAGAEAILPGRKGGQTIWKRQDIADALPLDIPAHHLGLYASHPMGTNRMGSEPSESVVDPRGRVWGWRNLHVADASIFPTSLGVNPQVTTMAMGLMVGEEVASR